MAKKEDRYAGKRRYLKKERLEKGARRY